jgi:hypothetical protein
MDSDSDKAKCNTSSMEDEKVYEPTPTIAGVYQFAVFI